MEVEKVVYDKKTPFAFDDTKKGVEEHLKMSLERFTRETTTYTAKYITPKKTIEVIPRNSALSGIGAKFIGDVKSHFAGLKKPDQLSNNRPYCEYFRPISTYKEINDVVEVDLNKAYWQAALNLGYLTQSIYKKALDPKINKTARLVALGVLGKKTGVSNFEPPYEEVETIFEYAETRVFWDNIVYTIGVELEQTVKQYLPNIYGVWFDAIFCDKKIAQPLRKFLQRRGYEASTEKISSYIVEPRDGIRPGAKLTRVFANGDVKKMDVSYIKPEDRLLTFEDFVKKVVNSM